MALFKGETTKWEDVQIKMGNFAEREADSPSNEERFRSTMAQADLMVKQDFVNTLLQASVDEDTDLIALRRNRLRQLERQGEMSTVHRITRENYIDQVTEGSQTSIVVVLMDRGGGTSFMEKDLSNLAHEWINEISPSKGVENMKIRFGVGDIDDLIGHEFPKDALPFAVVYAYGECQAQLQKATIPGIRSAILDAALHTTLPENTQDPFTSEFRRAIEQRKTNSDDEDDYQKSKGYMSTEFARNVLRQ